MARRVELPEAYHGAARLLNLARAGVVTVAVDDLDPYEVRGIVDLLRAEAILMSVRERRAASA